MINAMSTLSLKASQSIFEIVGNYETEKVWNRTTERDGKPFWVLSDSNPHNVYHYLPAPNFAELVRILKKLQDTTKNNEVWKVAWVKMISTNLVEAYISGKTEPEGMAAAEVYLMNLL